MSYIIGSSHNDDCSLVVKMLELGHCMQPVDLSDCTCGKVEALLTGEPKIEIRRPSAFAYLKLNE